MSKKLEHPHLSKNGGKQYYLQFHIKPWMKRFMPTELRDRKNFKQSLKTSSLFEALNRMPIVLEGLGLALNPQTQDIEPDPSRIISDDEWNRRQQVKNEAPEEAYHRARANASMLSAEDLKQVIEVEDSLFHDDIEELHKQNPKQAKFYSEQHYARQEGYLRILNKEDTLLTPAPHRYEATLKTAAKILIKDYKDEGRNPKTIGKVNVSVNKFLDYLEQDDLKLSLITKRHVSKYIKASRIKGIPRNTFSMELGLLGKVFKAAEEEGMVSDNLTNPFLGHRPLQNFQSETPKGIYTDQHAVILANEAVNAKRYDILVTVAVSYYTGMRSSELFGCSLTQVNDIACLNIQEGKTASSIRKVPLHKHLKAWLESNLLLPEIGKPFAWSAPTKDAFNKRFNKFSDRYLITKHNVDEESGTLSHHSFRHGMSTRLHRLGLTELQVAHVVGHSRETVAQTTSGKSYIKEAEISELQIIINKIEEIDLPMIPESAHPVTL